MKALDRLVILTISLMLFIYLGIQFWNTNLSKEDVSKAVNDQLNKFVISRKLHRSESVNYDSAEQMRLRKEALNDICKKNPHLRMNYSDTEKYNTGRLRYLISDDRNILYCPVPKCGWSSWRQLFFAYFANQEAIRELNDLTKTGWLTEWKKAQLTPMNAKEGTKVLGGHHIENRMIFVRNPYDRLVSAYRDKVLRNNGTYIRAEKNPCAWITDESPLLTFQQFIQCILQKARKNSGGNLSKFDAGSTLDMHWKPQSLLCHVCEVEYNIIGYFDHMNEDMLEALKYLGMDGLSPTWGNTNLAKISSNAEYYSKLSQSQLVDLQKLYKYDFALFRISNKWPQRT